MVRSFIRFACQRLPDLCVALALITFSACAPANSPVTSATNTASPQATPAAPSTNQQFEVSGWLREFRVPEKKAKILHDAIPGYMEKMTMEFEVRGEIDWNAVHVGDRVAFTLKATQTDGWIEKLRKVDLTNTPPELVTTIPATNPPAIIPIPRIAHYKPLLVGDTLPDYPFTNHLGKATTLGAFRGQAIAFTFFFTTCPFPTMCPRLTTQFRDAYHGLLGNGTGPTNWHLFSITIDPERDGAEALKSYAKLNESNPDHWTYLTGDVTEIETFGRHFGLNFFREAGALNHNLRTVVVSPQGKITKIFIGNEWKASELVEEMQQALRQ